MNYSKVLVLLLNATTCLTKLSFEAKEGIYSGQIETESLPSFLQRFKPPINSLKTISFSQRQDSNADEDSSFLKPFLSFFHPTTLHLSRFPNYSVVNTVNVRQLGV